MKHLCKTERELAAAMSLAEAALAEARKPHEAPISAAEQKLAEAEAAAAAAATAKQAADSEHESLSRNLEQLSGEPISGLAKAVRRAREIVAEAVTEADALRIRAAEELAQKTLELDTAREELVAARAPIQTCLNLVAALKKASTTLTAEAGEVERTITGYIDEDRRRREWEEQESRKCRSCHDRPGGCHDCDFTR